MSSIEAFKLRPLQITDHEAWLPLWHGYQNFYKEEIPEATTRMTWRRLIDPREPMFGAIALIGDQAVGIVHWVFHRSCWTVENYCYLQDLFVVEEKRGAGIGRKLIEHVYGIARAAGCARVYWLTHETNTDAMLLYDRIAERSGFVQYNKILK